MSQKLEISKEGYLNLIRKVYENKLEERELALDRYRKADEQMETTEQFMLIGKNAVSFLNLASLTTNELASLAKEIKGIVYKDEVAEIGDEFLSDSWKQKIQESVDEVEKSKRSRNLEDTDEPSPTLNNK